MVEQAAAHLPAGADIDIDIDIVVQAGSQRIALGVKFPSAPTVTKGLWHALANLQPQRAVVVAPVARRYPKKDGVEVVPAWEVPRLLAG